MAKLKQSMSNDIKALQDMIFSSNYGLSRSFVDKNSNIVIKSNKAVSDTLAGFGINTINRTTNSMQELTSLVSQSIRFKGDTNTGVNLKNGFFKGDDDVDALTGIKQITPLGNMDASEHDVINTFASMHQSFLNVTEEYRGVVELIPEVGRAIKNIVRDILSVSELSGRALNKLYEDDTVADADETQKDKSNTYICNDLLQREIVDKNDLETKLKRWTFESAVCGVKPIAFIPYDYIIRQMETLNTGKYGLNLNVKRFSSKIKSGESCKVFESKDQEEKFYNVSIESCFAEMFDPEKVDEKTAAAKAIESYDALFTDDLVDIYARSCESLFAKEYSEAEQKSAKAKDDEIRRYQITGTKSVEAQQQIELLDSLTKKYSDEKKRFDELDKDKRKEEAKKGLRELAKYIDEHIDVVKPGASSAMIANKIMNERDRYSSFYNLGENYLMAEGLQRKQRNLKKEQDGSRDGVSNPDFVYDTESELGKECLIVPYSPESVIPVNVNGEYMGFYALEYENEIGAMWKKRRRAGTFTDYVKNQGMGDDAALLGGSAPMVAYGGADPMENNLYSPLAMYNYSANQYMTGDAENDQRFDIMKIVTLRVLAHRLRDPDLADNKSFKDAVMALLRNDCLTKKKVQFTFIPPEYMCYMTYQVDDNGVPKSILDGTLLWAYMYISSVLSSAMIKMLKSADKEKYEVSVGLLKNAGYTIDELQRVLSTRNIYSSNMFGSLSSVIKNAGTYQRMIIPVFNDKKLYDVTQIENINNVSPDDDFTGKLLQSILGKIYINSGMQGSFDSPQFAHEFAYQNIEYRSNIIEEQANYEKHFTKIIKILANYSALDTFNSKAEIADADDKKKHDNGDIDISKIKVELNISTMMSMSNITDVLDQAKNVANSIAEMLNLADGSAVETARNTIFKRKIIEKYANIIEWAEIEKILTEAEIKAPQLVNHQKKFAKIDAKLQEEDEDENSGTDDFGGGGGDDLGSDLGGPF